MAQTSIGSRSKLDAYFEIETKLARRFPVEGGQSYRLAVGDPDARRYDATDAQNFVDLMTAIRTALPQDKLLSMDVPSRHADMDAYEMPGIVPGLDKSVDYWNMMTYDAMNRRDNVSAYAAGLPVVDDNYAFYTGKGIDAMKLVVGFPMYGEPLQLHMRSCTR